MKRFDGQISENSTMSEKYDGVQGVWDGRRMWTRTGNEINAPKWWIKDLPRKPLRGELFGGRGRFDETRGIIMSKTPDRRWAGIRFMVFSGSAETKYSETVEQIAVESVEHFKRFYKSVIDGGGEGIVLRLFDGELVKYKIATDDDAKVVGIEKGKGKFSGLMGALVIELRDGKRMKLGNGFSDMERKRPPKKGQIVKFNYEGFTSNGLPRFAKFAGVRAERGLNF